MKTLLSALCALLCTAALPALAQQTVPRTVFVHLFEWQWNDIASECENYLGPNGFSAVQVSPPQKSISGSEWWTRYQPVSYAIEGRSGTRQEFADMVRRCKAAGVDIYADAVINHMAAWDRNFPEAGYSSQHFHTCRTKINYGDMWQVQNCDLEGLNDLKTEDDYVRTKITAYLADLQSLGVAGFRIDAAKHMPPADISNIVGRLAGNPYVYQEVIYGAGEPVHPFQYTYISDVTEFQYSNTLGHYFKGRGPIKDLKGIGSWNGWLSSAEAQIFVANHDNQRQNTSNIITHKDGGNLNVLAHVFMMGWPYGYPQIMSSYDWNSHNQGPPSSGASNCTNGWLCEHRIRAIKNMVAFRNNTSSAFVATNLWDNGNNQLAWGRGGRGYVAINREDGGTLNRTFQTGMPAGTYCDIIHADFNYATGACSGATVTVDGSGNATFSVNHRDAVAFHVGAKVGVPCLACGGATTTVETNDKWYFRGTPNNWGSTPMTLRDGLYCSSQIFGAASTNPRFKIDHFANWDESYPAADYKVNADTTYDICFNPSNQSITATPTNPSSSPSSSAASSTASSTASSSTGGMVNVRFVCNNGATFWGQSVYAVGNISELGNWKVAVAKKLNPIGYPKWEGDIQVPANTNIQWKCVKRHETNTSTGIQWQGGSNTSVNTGSGNVITSGGF